MKKICCMSPMLPEGMKLLKQGYVQVEKPEEADAVLIRSIYMKEEELTDGLLAVARAGVGVNNIPVKACSEKGIVVFNTPGANKNGVKELVIAGLLLASRDIVGGISWCQENAGLSDIAAKAEEKKRAFSGCEIRRKKLGVIGLGAIGREVAETACALGMEVYGYDPFLSVEGAWNLPPAIRRATELDVIYETCDYITLHVPLMDSTRHMVGKVALDKMKDGVIFLNFARDQLVDEDAMAAALKTGKVKKYVTDFPNEKTVHMEGALVIPHLGASTRESEEVCAVMAAEELKDYLENGTIQNSVNYPACDLGQFQGAFRIGLLYENSMGMEGRIRKILSGEGIEIKKLMTACRKENGYTLLETDSPMTEECRQFLDELKGMRKVRILYNAGK